MSQFKNYILCGWPHNYLTKYLPSRIKNISKQQKLIICMLTHWKNQINWVNITLLSFLYNFSLKVTLLFEDIWIYGIMAWNFNMNNIVPLPKYTVARKCTINFFACTRRTTSNFLENFTSWFKWDQIILGGIHNLLRS